MISSRCPQSLKARAQIVKLHTTSGMPISPQQHRNLCVHTNYGMVQTGQPYCLAQCVGNEVKCGWIELILAPHPLYCQCFYTGIQSRAWLIVDSTVCRRAQVWRAQISQLCSLTHLIAYNAHTITEAMLKPVCSAALLDSLLCSLCQPALPLQLGAPKNFLFYL